MTCRAATSRDALFGIALLEATMRSRVLASGGSWDREVITGKARGSCDHPDARILEHATLERPPR